MEENFNSNDLNTYNNFDNYDDFKFGSFNNNELNEKNILINPNLNLLRIFKNEDIYEQLENKYLNDSIRLTSHKDNNNEDNDNDDNYRISDIKARLVVLILDNKLYKIKSSADLFKLLSFVFLLMVFLSILISLLISFELSIAFFMSVILIFSLIIYLPRLKHENDYSSISKELPYALRQLSTELRAGKSLFDALVSIVESDYGVLSMEFSRLMEEIKYGESTENAFLNLEKRVNSPALSRVIYEILASLRIGTNLSNSLNIIAEDVNFDMRMKLKEHSEKLNAFIMIYTFLAILAPVIVLTMLLAASVVIGDLVPSELIMILYAFFFPMIIVFLAFAIKKLEPRI